MVSLWTHCLPACFIYYLKGLRIKSIKICRRSSKYIATSSPKIIITTTIPIIRTTCYFSKYSTIEIISWSVSCSIYSFICSGCFSSWKTCISIKIWYESIVISSLVMISAYSCICSTTSCSYSNSSLVHSFHSDSHISGIYGYDWDISITSVDHSCRSSLCRCSSVLSPAVCITCVRIRSIMYYSYCS